MTPHHQFRCFFLTLINHKVLTTILDQIDPQDRDQAQAGVMYYLEISLLEAIIDLLPTTQWPIFLQKYSEQPESPKLLDYLDTCPQSSRLALSEVLNRALFGLQSSLLL